MSDFIDRQAAIEAVGLTTWAGSRISQLPTVEAIPIDYIKEQIEMYDGLSDIRDDRWGDIYHTFSQVLRGLIVHWRKDVGGRKWN